MTLLIQWFSPLYDTKYTFLFNINDYKTSNIITKIIISTVKKPYKPKDIPYNKLSNIYLWQKFLSYTIYKFSLNRMQKINQIYSKKASKNYTNNLKLAF